MDSKTSKDSYPIRQEKIISEVVDQLSNPCSYLAVAHRAKQDEPMPSLDDMRTLTSLLRSVIFPGYFGPSELTPRSMRYYIGSALDRLYRILVVQIERGFHFSADDPHTPKTSITEKAHDLAGDFIQQIPEIRALLSTDVLAAFEGDPAGRNPGEIIFCYPSLQALTHYRTAHVLFKLGVPLLPRIITEMAHSITGIDIHPGAEIGEYFFMDHGTGIVIGETSIIGKNVRLYQGVTLGAKSFPLDENGKPIKGLPRHPVVEDDVIIYSGATILGRVTIGKGSVIGGNVWLTQDVAPGSTVIQGQPGTKIK